MSLLKSLGLGTEAYENPLDENSAGFVATGDESETASAAILEATRESAEVDAAEAEASAIDDATDDLEDQAELAEVAVESGNFTPMMGELQRIGLKSILTRVAGPALAKRAVDGKLLPARENFEANPRDAAVMACESIKETIREFWNAVKAQFKKVMDTIRNWFVTTVDAAPRLRARAARIQKRAENTQGTAKGKIKVSSAPSIHVNGSLGDTAVAGFNDLVAKGKEILTVTKADDVEKASKDILEEVEKAGKAKKLGEAGGLKDKVNKALISVSGGQVPETAKQFGANDEVTITASKELPGGVVLLEIKGKGEAKDAVKRTRNAKVSAKSKAPAVKDKEYEPLALNTIDRLMNKVQEGCEVIIDYKKAANKLDSYQKDIIAKGDTATNAVDKDLDSTTQRELRSLIQGSVGVFRKAITFRKDVIQLILTAGGGFCTYAEASLGAYTTKDKD